MKVRTAVMLAVAFVMSGSIALAQGGAATQAPAKTAPKAAVSQDTAKKGGKKGKKR